MPCNDGGGPWTTYADHSGCHEKIDTLTALLCEACNIVSQTQGGLGFMSKDLRKWWTKHQLEDAERQAEETEKQTLERLADEAMGKLSTQEIEALRSTGRIR